MWAKQLTDGSVAVGLFNRGESVNPITVNFKDLGIRKQVQVRDLWQHKNLGAFDGSFTTQGSASRCRSRERKEINRGSRYL